MTGNEKKEREFHQCLKDAGCDENTAEKILKCRREGKTEEELKWLAAARKKLLDDVHEGEKKISCLDYLCFHIQKEQENKKETDK